MNDPFVLGTNRARVQSISDTLTKVKSRSHADRAKARAAAYKAEAEENSAYAGVATLEQTDATFIDLNIHADDTLGAAFCDFTTLEIGAIPIYKTRQQYPIRVQVGHLAGGPPAAFYATVQNLVQVTPFQYFSDETLVPNLVTANFDLADFKERENALERLARDMSLARQRCILNTMLSQPVFQDLSTSIAAYLGSTPFVGKNPYVLDTGVVTGSVPTTNLISAAGEGGLTRTVFMKQRTYANQADRDLVRMFVPISGAPWEAYWQQASIVAYTTGQGNQDVRKAIPPSKWEEAVSTSFRKRGAYMKWFDDEAIYVQPTNVLPSGCWVTSTNLPAILGWDQLSASITEEESIKSNRAFNRRYEARSIALAQPDPMLLNFVVGTFA